MGMIVRSAPSIVPAHPPHRHTRAHAHTHAACSGAHMCELPSTHTPPPLPPLFLRPSRPNARKVAVPLTLIIHACPRVLVLAFKHRPYFSFVKEWNLLDCVCVPWQNVAHCRCARTAWRSCDQSPRSPEDDRSQTGCNTRFSALTAHTTRLESCCFVQVPPLLRFSRRVPALVFARPFHHRHLHCPSVRGPIAPFQWSCQRCRGAATVVVFLVGCYHGQHHGRFM